MTPYNRLKPADFDSHQAPMREWQHPNGNTMSTPTEAGLREMGYSPRQASDEQWRFAVQAIMLGYRPVSEN